jgi:hypothetical protein
VFVFDVFLIIKFGYNKKNGLLAIHSLGVFWNV